MLQKPSIKSFRFLALGGLFFFSVSLAAAPLLQRGNEQLEQQSNSAQNTGESSQDNALASYEFYKQLEAMRMEVQQLRGILEEQNYQIERLKKAEKERYADLDRRINEVQQQKQASSVVAATNTDISSNAGDVGAMDEDLKTYRSAKQKVDSKEYNAAIAEFTLYLEFFPAGKYVPQAHYWLGELYMVLEIPEYDNARTHFETVIKTFPDHAKVPDCLYKIGLIQKTQNKTDDAKLTFSKLIKDFPKSATASLAKTQLESL